MKAERIQSFPRLGGALVLVLAALLARPATALQEMSDGALASESGQGALFFSDKIAPTGTAGSATDFTFYRLGLNTDLEFNLNIDKLQLGCGGSNENLIANACDIDLDYVRFMGRSGTAPGAAVISNFLARRPYVEFAIKNDSIGTQRDIVGFKIGFESADGMLGIGRTYANGQVNVEHGGTCDTGAGDGAGALACNSGIRSVSGNLNLELSANILAGTTLGDQKICFGNTATADHANCDGNAGNNSNTDIKDPFYTSVSGTRMTDVTIADIPAYVWSGSLDGTTAAADLKESLRFIHQILLDSSQSKDFFISFQREQVAYPKYDKSGYAATTNTGWWLNVPYAAIMNASASVDLGLLDALSALGEGANMTNVALGQIAPSNCYGSSNFC